MRTSHEIKKITAKLLATLLLFALLPTADTRGKEIKLKSADDAKKEMETYYRVASRAESEGKWRDVASMGISAVMTDWEREALLEVDSEIKKAGNTGESLRAELLAEFESRKAEVKKELLADADKKEAKWKAEKVERPLLIIGQAEMSDILDMVKGKADAEIAKNTNYRSMDFETQKTTQKAVFSAWMNEWESQIKKYKDSENASDSELKNKLMGEAGGRSEEYRKELSKQLDKKIEEVKKRQEMELRMYMTSEKNAYFDDYFTDKDSLRKQSEEQAASTVVSNIIDGAENNANLLISEVTSVEAGKSAAVKDANGSAEAIKTAIERGIKAWQDAENQLIEARLSWEGRSAENINANQKLWEDAYDELQSKRSDWISKVRLQIFEGNNQWDNKIAEADANYAKSKAELQTYMEKQTAVWDDYSSGIREMIVTGSSTYKTAIENLSWLEEYKNTLNPADTLEGPILAKVIPLIDTWNNVIKRMNLVLSTAETQYHGKDMTENVDGGENNGTGLLTDDRYDSAGNVKTKNWVYTYDGKFVLNGNYAIENDPYLMSQAEYELELLRLNKDYWTERLSKAQAVYDYANNELGRLSADEQRAKLEAAQAEYARLKTAYNAANNTLTEKLTAMNTKKEGMETAKEALDMARKSYEGVESEYKLVMMTMMYLTKPEAVEMIRLELDNARAGYVAAVQLVNGAQEKYISALKEYNAGKAVADGAVDTAQYAERIKTAIKYGWGDEETEGEKTGYIEMYEKYKTDVIGGGFATVDELMAKIDSMISGGLITKVELSKYNVPDELKADGDNIVGIVNIYKDSRDRYKLIKDCLSKADNEAKAKASVWRLVNETRLANNLEAYDDAKLAAQLLKVKESADDEYILERARLLEVYGGVITKEDVDTYKDDPDSLGKLFYQRSMESFQGTAANVLIAPDYAAFAGYQELVMKGEEASLREAVLILGGAVKKARDDSASIIEYVLEDFKGKTNAEIDAMTRSLAKLKESALSAASQREVMELDENIAVGNLIANDIFTGVNLASDYTGKNIYEKLLNYIDVKIADKSKNGTNDGTAGLSEADRKSLMEYIAARKAIESQKDVIYGVIDQAGWDEFKTSISGINSYYADVKGFCGNYQSYKDKTLQVVDAIAAFTTEVIVDGSDHYVFDKALLALSDEKLAEKGYTKRAVTDADEDKFDNYIIMMGRPESMPDFIVDGVVMMRGDAVDAAKETALSMYAERNFDKSMEVTARKQNDGGILGFVKNLLGLYDVPTVENGNMTLASLKTYGEKVRDYIDSEEFSKEPEAVKRAFNDAYGKYCEMVIAQGIVDNRYADLGAMNANNAVMEKKIESLTKIQSVLADYFKFDPGNVSDYNFKLVDQMITSVESVITELTETYGDSRLLYGNNLIKGDFLSRAKQCRDEIIAGKYMGTFFNNETLMWNEFKTSKGIGSDDDVDLNELSAYYVDNYAKIAVEIENYGGGRDYICGIIKTKLSEGIKRKRDYQNVMAVMMETGKTEDDLTDDEKLRLASARKTLDAAKGYNFVTGIENYIAEKGITDAYDKNFLRLYALKKGNVNTAYLYLPAAENVNAMNYELANELISILDVDFKEFYSVNDGSSTTDEKGYIDVMGQKVKDKEIDLEKWSRIYEFLATKIIDGTLYYKNFREYMGQVKQTTEGRTIKKTETLSNGKTTDINVSALDDKIISTEGLNYDEGSGTYKKDNKTLADYRNEWTATNKILKLTEVFYGESMTSDKLGETNFTGNALVNNLLDKMTDFNKSLCGLFYAGQAMDAVINGTYNLIQITKDTGGVYNFSAGEDFQKGYINRGDLITGVRSNILVSGKIKDGAEAVIGSTLDLVTYCSDQQALLSTFEQLQKETEGNYSGAVAEKAKLQEAMLKSGYMISSISSGMKDYVNSAEYNNVTTNYDNQKAAYETRQNQFDAAKTDYEESRKIYFDTIELVGKVYEEMDKARKAKEKEEAVFEYAETSYLYTNEGKTDTAKDGEDKLKSDAAEELAYVTLQHADIQSQFTAKETEAKNMNANVPTKDAGYVDLENKLNAESMRSFRIDRLGYAVQKKIEELTANVQKLEDAYNEEAQKFIPLGNDTDKEKIEARNRIIDGFMNFGYVNLPQNKWYSRDAIEDVLMAYQLHDQDKANVWDDLTGGYANQKLANILGGGLKSIQGDKYDDNFKGNYLFGIGGHLASDLRIAAMYYDNGFSSGQNLFMNGNDDRGYREVGKSYGGALMANGSPSPFKQYFEMWGAGDLIVSTNKGDKFQKFFTNYLKHCENTNKFWDEADSVLNNAMAGLLALPFTILTGEIGTSYLATFVNIEKAYKKADKKLDHYKEEYEDAKWYRKADKWAKYKLYKWTVFKPLQGVRKLLFDSIGKNCKSLNKYYKAAVSDYMAIGSELKTLQVKKLALLKARAELAKYTNVKSVDGEVDAGNFEYYNPVNGEKVSVRLYTLKEVYRKVGVEKASDVYGGGNFNMALLNSDLDMMVRDGSNIPPVPGKDYYLAAITEGTNELVYDENGYVKKDAGGNIEYENVMNSGKVIKAYSVKMDNARYDRMKEYLKYSNDMTAKGYDDVVVKRRQETYLYTLMMSAVNLDGAGGGRKYGGYGKSSLDYFSFVEGFTTEDMDSVRNIKEPTEQAAMMKNIASTRMGLNDMELAQRASLQEEAWKIKKQELLDKREKWNETVENIMLRGTKQWSNMEDSFLNAWKNSVREMEEAYEKGVTAYEAKQTEIKAEKEAWLKKASSNSAEAMSEEELAGLTMKTQAMLSEMKEKYGDKADVSIDVGSILSEILKSQPKVLSEKLMKMVEETDTSFAITEMTNRSVDGKVIQDYQDVMEDYQQALRATANVKLLSAMKDLLKKLEKNFETTRTNYVNMADSFASQFGYKHEGKEYKKSAELGVAFGMGPDINKSVKAYNPMKFNQDAVFSNKEYNQAVEEIMDPAQEDWYAEEYSNMVMSLMQVRFTKEMEKVTKEAGVLAVIGSNSGGPTGKGGEGQLGRISNKIIDNERDFIKLQGNVNIAKQIVVTAAVAVASVFTAGAAGMAYAAYTTAKAVEKGATTIGNAVKTVAVAAACAVINNFVPGTGPLISAGIQGGSGMVNFDKKGRMSVDHSQRAVINAGITVAGGMAACGSTALGGTAGTVMKISSNFATNTLQSGMTYSADGKLTGFNAKVGFAVGAFAAGSTFAAEQMMSDEKTGQDASWGEQERYDVKNKLISNTLFNGMAAIYQTSTGVKMTNQLKTNNALTLEEYSSRAGSKLAVDYQKSQQEQKSETSDKESKSPLGKLMDFADTLIGAAGVGLKWAKETAGKALGAIKEGAMSAGSALASGAKSLAAGAMSGAAALGGSIAGMFAGGAPAMDEKVFECYGGPMDEKPFNIYDLNDAVTAANTGDHYNQDIKGNMKGLLSSLNESMGLEGDSKFKTAQAVQEAVANGELTADQVEAAALLMVNGDAAEKFAMIYGVAQGQRDGSIAKGANGYYSTEDGSMVAGMWEQGVSKDQVVVKPESNVNAGVNKDGYFTSPEGNKSSASPIIYSGEKFNVDQSKIGELIYGQSLSEIKNSSDFVETEVYKRIDPDRDSKSFLISFAMGTTGGLEYWMGQPNPHERVDSSNAAIRNDEMEDVSLASNLLAPDADKTMDNPVPGLRKFNTLDFFRSENDPKKNDNMLSYNGMMKFDKAEGVFSFLNKIGEVGSAYTSQLMNNFRTYNVTDELHVQRNINDNSTRHFYVSVDYSNDGSKYMMGGTGSMQVAPLYGIDYKKKNKK